MEENKITHTLEELKEFLKANASEEDLLDVLNITAEQLVERFDDVIDDKFDTVLDYFGMTPEEDGDDLE